MVTVAVVSFWLVVYTYVGYPVLIALLARMRPMRIREDPDYLPTVSACIPVYNAAAALESKIESMFALDYPREKLEILVYTDGCTDDTEALVERLAARDDRVKLVRGPERKGKPTALNCMLEVATGEVLMLTDSRQKVDPGTLRALTRMLGDPSVGCVSGNLIFLGAAASEAYWRYECWIRGKEARFRGVVGVSGPIYGIRRADVPPVPVDLILDDVLIPMRVALAGKRVVYAEEARAYDASPTDTREFNRKIRTLAGNFQLFAKLPRMLVPFLNPLWFETVSHKIMRLVCPWALLAMLVSTTLAWLDPATHASTVLRALVVVLGLGQAGFYLFALLGRRGGRVGYMAQSFVLMNIAAIRGFFRWIRGAQEVTWAMPGGTGH